MIPGLCIEAQLQQVDCSQGTLCMEPGSLEHIRTTLSAVQWQGRREKHDAKRLVTMNRAVLDLRRYGSQILWLCLAAWQNVVSGCVGSRSLCPLAPACTFPQSSPIVPSLWHVLESLPMKQLLIVHVRRSSEHRSCLAKGSCAKTRCSGKSATSCHGANA